MSKSPQPTGLTVHNKSKVLDVEFDDGAAFSIPFELLRVYSPSAEVMGHGPGQEVLQVGKRDVGIAGIEPVGNYAVQPTFSDGHNTGLYTWDYLYKLGSQKDALWATYMDRLHASGFADDSGRIPGVSLTGPSKAAHVHGPPADTSTGAWPALAKAAPGQALASYNAGNPTGLPTATNTTHFGYKTVAEDDKVHQVAKVFHSVAAKYDVMNDVMSGGLHRLWKMLLIANAAVRPGFKVLDIAGGTGDLAKVFAKQAGPSGEVWLTDINESMLRVGRDRLLNRGLVTPTLLCDAEKLPFPDNYFDRVSVAFGLRNMTHKDLALAEMRRVLKPGGKLLVLEFSKVAAPLQKPYDVYSFQVLPWMGQKIAGDAESYRYLAESIRMHPDQETLKTMMQDAGLERVQYYNLTAGVAALHTGIKL